jgi:hypothetical protein
VGNRGGTKRDGAAGGLNRNLKKSQNFVNRMILKKVLLDLLPTAERSHGNRLMMSTIEC